MGEEEFAEAGYCTGFSAAWGTLDEGQTIPPAFGNGLILFGIEILLILELYLPVFINLYPVGLSSEVLDDMLTLGKLLHLVLIIIDRVQPLISVDGGIDTG